MQSIHTDLAPAPSGHYSQAMAHAGFIFTAAQLPLVPGQPPDRTPSIEAQTAQVLDNLQAILQAAGSDWAGVLRINIYVADIAQWDRINTVYARVLGPHRPARAVLPMGTALHHGYAVAMDAIAIRQPNEPMGA